LNVFPTVDAVDRALLERANTVRLRTELNGGKDETELSTDDLALATALLHERILRVPENIGFREALEKRRQERVERPTLFGIVPGAFYRHHNHTGADGRRIVAILRKLGVQVEVIPIRSFGRVYENARIINAWLRAQKSGNIALVTLSKGSADSKAALQLGNGGSEWDRVHTWISVSGLTEGTPLIAWLRRQPLRMIGIRLLLALRGQSFAAADDLRRDESNPLRRWPSLPLHLRLVHVAAFPTRRHLQHPWAFRGYERLAWLGPNDGGGIILSDTEFLPGIICPIWGADHYLDPTWDSTALLRQIVLEAVGTERHANRCASKPTAPPATRSSA
jgi:hypothetical protein